jgi:nucleoside-diphosphate-sugar epimerase
MKLALVDGALGHTGSFLVKKLLENDWKVVATDLNTEAREKLMTKEKVFKFNFKYLYCREWEGVTYIPSDLTKKETLEGLFTNKIFSDDKRNYDTIFHPASLYDYGASYELLHEINYNGLKNFLEVILNYSKNSKTKPPRFIHWSTCGVYGEPNYQYDDKGIIYPADETTSYNPPNNYSQTKVEQEKLIFEISDNFPNFKYTILRSGPIYGPYQSYGMYHILNTVYILGHSILAKVYPKRKKLMMPLVHVEDLVNAAIFLAENDKSIGEVYNVLNDSPLQEQFLEFIYNTLGISFSTIPMPYPFFKLITKFATYLAKRKDRKARKYGIRPKFDLPMVEYLIHQYYFSNKKLKDLGFKFKYNDFRKGILETVQWYIENGWFPMQENILPEYINIQPKPPIQSKTEYKTPMEGGAIF